MSPVTYAVLVAVVIALLYVALSLQVYRRAFLPPKPMWLDDFTFTPFEFQADYEEVELATADGVNFGAWHFRQPGSPQTVIISGGHKGQRQGALGIAVALWRKGFNVVLYSYRGMPGSDRAPITFGIKEVLELQAAIAFARKRIPSARIGLLGYSMGAVVSLLGAAGEPRVQALVLDSPFSDLGTLLAERRPQQDLAGDLVTQQPPPCVREPRNQMQPATVFNSDGAPRQQIYNRGSGGTGSGRSSRRCVHVERQSGDRQQRR